MSRVEGKKKKKKRQQLFINLLQLNPLTTHFAHTENPYGADDYCFARPQLIN